MFEREIKFIYDFSLNQVRRLGSSFTLKQLASCGLHPALHKYIEAEIDFLIYEDRKRLIEKSNFDYSGESISKHFEQITSEIKTEKKLTLEYISQLLLHAISFNINYLAQPRWALAKLVFPNDESLNVIEVKQILNYVYFYPHIKQVIEKYFVKKQLVIISKSEFEDLITKVQDQIFSLNVKSVFEKALHSMAEFYNIGSSAKTKVPLTAVELFIKENTLTELTGRFIDAFDSELKLNIEVTELQGILFSPVPLKRKHYLDRIVEKEQPDSLFKSKKEEKKQAEPEVVETKEEKVETLFEASPEEAINEDVKENVQQEEVIKEEVQPVNVQAEDLLEELIKGDNSEEKIIELEETSIEDELILEEEISPGAELPEIAEDKTIEEKPFDNIQDEKPEDEQDVDILKDEIETEEIGEPEIKIDEVIENNTEEVNLVVEEEPVEPEPEIQNEMPAEPVIAEKNEIEQAQDSIIAEEPEIKDETVSDVEKEESITEEKIEEEKPLENTRDEKPEDEQDINTLKGEIETGEFGEPGNRINEVIENNIEEDVNLVVEEEIKEAIAEDEDKYQDDVLENPEIKEEEPEVVKESVDDEAGVNNKEEITEPEKEGESEVIKEGIIEDEVEVSNKEEIAEPVKEENLEEEKEVEDKGEHIDEENTAGEEVVVEAKTQDEETKKTIDESFENQPDLFEEMKDTIPAEANKIETKEETIEENSAVGDIEEVEEEKSFIPFKDDFISDLKLRENDLSEEGHEEIEELKKELQDLTALKSIEEEIEGLDFEADYTEDDFLVVSEEKAVSDSDIDFNIVYNRKSETAKENVEEELEENKILLPDEQDEIILPEEPLPAESKEEEPDEDYSIKAEDDLHEENEQFLEILDKEIEELSIAPAEEYLAEESDEAIAEDEDKFEDEVQENPEVKEEESKEPEVYKEEITEEETEKIEEVEEINELQDEEEVFPEENKNTLAEEVKNKNEQLDLADFFKGKDADKIIYSIFDEDTQDFIQTCDMITECNNLDEASGILDTLFKANHVKPSLKEAVLFKKIIEEYISKR